MRFHKCKPTLPAFTSFHLFILISAICITLQKSVAHAEKSAQSNSQTMSALRAGSRFSPYVIDSDSVELEPLNNKTVFEKEVSSLKLPENAEAFNNFEFSSTTHKSVSSTSPRTPSSTRRPAKKPTKRKHSPSTHKVPSSANANSGHRRKKPHHPHQNLAGSQSHVESVPDPAELKPDQTCLIGDVCMRNGRLGYCYKPHAPVKFDKDDIETEDFYDMLQESCSHFFDENENLRHSLCCSPEQEETIARLNANIDLIRRSCPSCLINVKKLFCNLFCAPNQRDFIRVDRVKGETVMEVTYAISEHFVNTFFSSCQDVRVFGAYLLDYEYGCGKLKRANCTAVEFMRVLGSLSEIPFNFRPLIVESGSGKVLHPSSPSTVAIDGTLEANEETETIVGREWPRAVMNDTAFKCTEAPLMNDGTSMSPCHCDHCPNMCQLKKQQNSKPISANRPVPAKSTTHSKSTHKTVSGDSTLLVFSPSLLAAMYTFCHLVGRFFVV